MSLFFYIDRINIIIFSIEIFSEFFLCVSMSHSFVCPLVSDKICVEESGAKTMCFCFYYPEKSFHSRELKSIVISVFSHTILLIGANLSFRTIEVWNMVYCNFLSSKNWVCSVWHKRKIKKWIVNQRLWAVGIACCSWLLIYDNSIFTLFIIANYFCIYFIIYSAYCIISPYFSINSFSNRSSFVYPHSMWW